MHTTATLVYLKYNASYTNKDVNMHNEGILTNNIYIKSVYTFV